MTDYLEEELERARALLEEVRRLERSVPGRAVAEKDAEDPQRDGEAPEMAGASEMERDAGSGVRGGYPWALPGPERDGPLSGGAGGEGRDWNWNGVPVRGAAPAVDETRWAEWADRAFQRDSRRYDGGFYLY